MRVRVLGARMRVADTLRDAALAARGIASGQLDDRAPGLHLHDPGP